jgi:hypothetical protein
MKAVLFVALCAMAGAVEAQAADELPTAAAVEKRVEKLLPRQVVSAVKAAGSRRHGEAALALTFTDDADSMLLPAFASRTTPLPTRFFRVGVEWAF